MALRSAPPPGRRALRVGQGARGARGQRRRARRVREGRRGLSTRTRRRPERPRRVRRRGAAAAGRGRIDEPPRQGPGGGDRVLPRRVCGRSPGESRGPRCAGHGGARTLSQGPLRFAARRGCRAGSRGGRSHRRGGTRGRARYFRPPLRRRICAERESGPGSRSRRGGGARCSASDRGAAKSGAAESGQPHRVERPGKRVHASAGRRGERAEATRGLHWARPRRPTGS